MKCPIEGCDVAVCGPNEDSDFKKRAEFYLLNHLIKDHKISLERFK